MKIIIFTCPSTLAEHVNGEQESAFEDIFLEELVDCLSQNDLDDISLLESSREEKLLRSSTGLFNFAVLYPTATKQICRFGKNIKPLTQV